MINKNINVELLWKFADRANRWMADAEEREDWDDYFYYQGQKKVLNELIVMLGGNAID